MVQPSVPSSGFWVSVCVLLAVWAVAIGVVDPRGEFVVNDDWAYVKNLQSLIERGTLCESTGWGPKDNPGGPSLITHLLWGLLFTKVGGFSLTTLRVSVLVMGILGSIGMLVLLRIAGASVGVALLGALTLALNPLYLSQCFTFMTDITFVSLALFSLVFIHLGLERSRTPVIAGGLLFALAATLTRQLGIVIPAAFVATCFVHPRGRALGRIKMIVLAVGIAVVPWVMYEVFLQLAGSTPIIQTQSIYEIFTLGVPSYLTFLVGALIPAALAYPALFISPVLALRYGSFWKWMAFRYVVVAIGILCALAEVLILTGLWDPPVFMYRNVILNLGIGPILLKDTYILGIERLTPVSKPLYYLALSWGLLAMTVVLALGGWCLIRVVRGYVGTNGKPVSFLATQALLTTIFYLGIIFITGYHDRLLIPVSALLIVWFVADSVSGEGFLHGKRMWAASVITIAIIAVFSVAGVRDFMEMKRELAKADAYVTNDLKIDPCDFDGGFEFNAFHCGMQMNDFQPAQGLSWWWVRQEKYVVTLGPLPGYRIVRTFPFHRLLGKDGAIHVLAPAREPSD